MSTDAPSISVSPSTPLLDDELDVRLSNFPPATHVALRAEMVWLGRINASQATFKTDDTGFISLTTDAPLSGEYDDADPMGLFTTLGQSDPLESNHEVADYPEVTLTASIDGEVVTTTTVKRHLAHPEVTELECDHNELVGTLYLPSGDGSYPGILVFDGSGGGHADPVRPRLLASHGYAVFGLSYFGTDDLPEEFIEIPMEYFETALSYLRAHEAVRSNHLRVIGTSRGAEMALLLATEYSELDAVVSFVGSGLLFGSPDDYEKSAWTRNEDPLPCVRSPEDGDETAVGILPENEYDDTLLELVTAEDAAFIDDAVIPVESMDASLLMFSAEDDPLWDSKTLSQVVSDRLQENTFEHRYDHVCFAGAGHHLWAPYLPTVGRAGGTHEGNAKADVQSWNRLLTFFEEELRP